MSRTAVIEHPRNHGIANPELYIESFVQLIVLHKLLHAFECHFTAELGKGIDSRIDFAKNDQAAGIAEILIKNGQIPPRCIQGDIPYGGVMPWGCTLC